MTKIKQKPQAPVGSTRLVGAMARKLWTIGYKAACDAQPERFWGSQTWEKEMNIPGRKACWLALARHVLERPNTEVLGEEVDRLREALRSIQSFPVHSEPVGGAYAMQDIAHAALSPNDQAEPRPGEQPKL